MLNKDEIIYNSKSLVENWLSSIKGVESVWVEMCGDKGNDVYPCTMDNCGEIIGKLLYNNDKKYILLSFYGRVDGKKKLIGSIDIV